LKTDILVTGCVGFIGTNLSLALLKSGYNIIGLDNLSENYDVNIKKNRIKILNKSKVFHFVRKDLQNFAGIESIFRKNNIGTIIHLAADVGVRESIVEPIKYVDNNVKVTNNLLELSIKYDVEHFIFSSSSSVYGNNQGLLQETMIPHPVSPYAASKRSCELYGETYSYLYDINFTALRLFTVYGPHQRPDMAIARFVDSIHRNKPIKINGDGSTRRDFTYIDDIVDGFIRVMDKKFKYQIINLGTGKSITLSSLIEKIEKYTGKKAKVIYNQRNKADVEETLADITKAKELLEYNPRTSIDEGLKQYIHWYNTNIN